MRSTGKIATFLGLTTFLYMAIICCTHTDLTLNKTVHDAEIWLDRQIYQAGEVIPLKINLKDPLGKHEYCLLYTTSIVEDAKCFINASSSDVINVPDHLTIISGPLSVGLYSGGVLLDKKTVHIISEAASGKIEAYLGPKTLSVDHEEEAMLVTFPTDRYSNLTEDSTEVRFHYYGPQARKYEKNLGTSEGYASINFGQLSTTGTRQLGASAGKANMREKEIFYVPGIPAGVSIFVLQDFPAANGKQFLHLSTAPVKDQFGHLVVDGTYVDFYAEDSEGRKSMLQAMTIGGVARTELIYPDDSDLLTIWAEIPGLIQSNRVMVPFEENIASFPVNYEKNTQVLTIGPVSGLLKALVPDGTEVIFKYQTGQNIYQKILPLIDGVIRVHIDRWEQIDKARIINVKIGSKEKNIDL